MSANKQYLLDANVFIDAKNRYYGFNICPGFWSSLITLNGTKKVFSIDRIRNELLEQDDEIKKWVKNTAPETFFKKTEDQAVVNTFEKMIQWVYSEDQFTSGAYSSCVTTIKSFTAAYAINQPSGSEANSIRAASVN